MMTEHRFELTITLGNAAMRGERDIAAALERVAQQVREHVGAGKIMDENGNAVGRFNYHREVVRDE